MQTGDIVECVDAGASSRLLTKGRHYKVTEVNGSYVSIIADDGDPHLFLASVFVTPDTRPRYVTRGGDWLWTHPRTGPPMGKCNRRQGRSREEAVKLTKAQREALEKLAKAPCTPWDFGATTVSVLRRNKLIESYPTGSAVFAGTLRITPAGRKALEES